MRITPEQIDAIVDVFQTLNIDENTPPLPVNVTGMVSNPAGKTSVSSIRRSELSKNSGGCGVSA